eukprot:CAMPEP_0168357502 /NCGR_PEP_ID=MMETSP0228-20121227/622_1 /TAXON_ID=133427 /ORGANISM="Protoceratium reticulatum, Strain CCCM 535 (=CCMP 1889)" /LENGTH=196 /DNA_ID=CAMNT_0008370027 /DNA_START=193 /DNA_END=783 /DNA_ORIENTATION=-
MGCGHFLDELPAPLPEGLPHKPLHHQNASGAHAGRMESDCVWVEPVHWQRHHDVFEALYVEGCLPLLVSLLPVVKLAGQGGLDIDEPTEHVEALAPEEPTEDRHDAPDVSPELLFSSGVLDLDHDAAATVQRRPVDLPNRRRVQGLLIKRLEDAVQWAQVLFHHCPHFAERPLRTVLKKHLQSFDILLRQHASADP